MKNLPLGIQNLPEIIKGDYVYVDKTELFPELIKVKQLFLSRPRRFGKSLLLDSLEQLFRGNADVFSGLKIADSGYEFKKYPVIRLSMTLNSRNTEILETRIIKKLDNIAESYNVKLRDDDPGEALQLLIKDLSDKYGERVVALIDEYDDPVSKYIDNIPLAKANTDILSSFYVGFKEVDEYLRFVMVTGVTRYAMMGLSAGLNQLVDISFSPKFAAICGFTAAELDQFFGDRYDSTLEALKSIGRMPVESSVFDLRQKILDWYDGYTWDGRTRVLNPISILKFFNELYFKEYWNTSSPSINYLKNTVASNPVSIAGNNFQGYTERDLSLITVGELALAPFLFHTGYLTIDKIIEVDGKDQYSFKVPNFELKGSIYDFLLPSLSSFLTENINDETQKLNKSLQEQDGPNLTRIINAVFSRIPAVHYGKQLINEYFFHDILLGYFSGLVAEVRAEERGPLGDADLIVVTSEGLHVVIEIKYSASADPDKLEETLDKLANQGLKVIKEKKYGETYRQAGKNFTFIGLGVVGWGQAKAVFGAATEPTA
ncbi:MAG: ATP-binding protein [Deltaproteobacteria bacterium]|jgi:hypothetical protein|nr:ATP-binding protein [Deltaproteobacteria bacterium]